MFDKKGRGIISEIVSIAGTLIGIAIILFLLKEVGININLGEVLADGFHQIKDAIEYVKESF